MVLRLIRHVGAVVMLPFTVAVIVPWWIATRNGVTATVPHSSEDEAFVALGAGLLLIGFVLFASSLRRFFREGEGTLAPWDPPRRLVVTGPYRYVRNPMISGVLFVLFGEAAVLRSEAHAQWAVIFLIANFVYIPLLEEPMLEQRFGADYTEYCRHVRRFVPRLRPWSPGR